MFASFSNWNDEVGFLTPDNACLNMSFREYQIVMQALKAYAVEKEVYSEVAEIVNLVTNIEYWYKASKKIHSEKEE